MTFQNINGALRAIALRCDPEEIIEALGLSSQEIVLMFRDEVLENLSKFDHIENYEGEYNEQ